MKKIVLPFLLLLPFLLEAQYVKYPVVEWFTNTYCGICSSRNPAILDVVNKYEEKVHVLRIHPSVPYEICPLYQFDKEANGARQDYYGIGSTPTMYVEGKRSSSSPPTLEADINNNLGALSPIGIEVEEQSQGSRTVNVTISTSGEVPDGNYLLFVAIVERQLSFNASNGETSHPNTLRGFVSSATGDQIALPANGESTTMSYNYNLPGGVSGDQAYILAFIQEAETKEILNSGSKFNQASTNLTDVASTTALEVFPNPARNLVTLKVDTDQEIEAIQMLNISGQRIRTITPLKGENQVEIPVVDLSPGHYFLEVTIDGRQSAIRFLKS